MKITGLQLIFIVFNPIQNFIMSSNNEKNKKIQQILNNVFEVGFEGIPIPNWEKSDPFDELQVSI